VELLRKYYGRIAEISVEFDFTLADQSERRLGIWRWRTDGTAEFLDLQYEVEAMGGKRRRVMVSLVAGRYQELVYPDSDAPPFAAPTGTVGPPAECPVLRLDTENPVKAFHLFFAGKKTWHEVVEHPDSYNFTVVRQDADDATIRVEADQIVVEMRLDPARGWLPIEQRTTFVEHPENWFVWTVEDAKEVAAGLWYPTRMNHQSRIVPEAEGEGSEPTGEATLYIHSVIVNSGAPDADYGFDFPHGTMVWDKFAHRSYKVAQIGADPPELQASAGCGSRKTGASYPPMGPANAELWEARLREAVEVANQFDLPKDAPGSGQVGSNQQVASCLATRASLSWGLVGFGCAAMLFATACGLVWWRGHWRGGKDK